ncbi:MAG: hypothetical protein ACOYLS_01305 [Polymorphobacter sp.]
MASAVQIANLALVTIGDDEALVELSTDTRAGRAILAVFDIERDALLRAHPWNFAMTRASLPALADAPPFGFGYAYQLPADWMRFIDETDYEPFAIESGQILTDRAPPLNIRYVRRVTDTGLFDALFVKALAAAIAAQVAQRLSGSATVRANAMDEYAMRIAEAKKVDGQENPPEDLLEDDWVLARERDS